MPEEFVQQICDLPVLFFWEKSMTNEQLIKHILSGHVEAFRTLIVAHQKLVYHIVLRMGVSEAEREDVCQDIFVKIYRNLSRFQFESKLSTWIATIAYNTCINHLKKKKVPLWNDFASEEKTIEGNLSNDALPDNFTENQDLAERLQTEIDKLPPQLRTILSLYHLDEMSYAEIAQALSLPDGTVKSYLFRARKLLKQRLLQKYQQEELWQ